MENIKRGGGRKKLDDWCQVSEIEGGEGQTLVQCIYCFKKISKRIERVKNHLMKCQTRRNEDGTTDDKNILDNSDEVQNDAEAEGNISFLTKDVEFTSEIKLTRGGGRKRFYEWKNVSELKGDNEKGKSLVQCVHCNKKISKRIGRIKQHLEKCLNRRKLEGDEGDFDEFKFTSMLDDSNTATENESKAKELNFPSFVAGYLQDVIRMKEFENVLKKIKQKITHLSFLVQLMCKYEDFDRVYCEYKSVQEDFAGGNIGWEDNQYFKEWEKLQVDKINDVKDDLIKMEDVKMQTLSDEDVDDELQTISINEDERVKRGGGRKKFGEWEEVFDIEGEDTLVECKYCGVRISKRIGRIKNHLFQCPRRRTEQCMNDDKENVSHEEEDKGRQTSDTNPVQIDILKTESSDIEIKFPKKKKKGYNCEECNLKLTGKKAHAKHSFYVHEQKLCAQCGEFSEDFEQFWSHRSDCGGRENFFKCDICTLEFKVKYFFEKHMKEWHDADVVPTKVKKSQNLSKEICQDCGLLVSNLKAHMFSKHSTEKNHECHLCDKKFKSKAYLKKHVELRHSNFALSTCPYCSKTVKHLSDHLRLQKCFKKPEDDDDINFTCHKCGKVLLRKQGLEKHMREVHGEMRQCDFCEFKSKYPHNLKMHIKTVHEKKPVKETCPHCYKECVSLEWHISVYHPNIQYT